MHNLRGGLQLSDISENPNNDRIGGDPLTHPLIRTNVWC